MGQFATKSTIKRGLSIEEVRKRIASLDGRAVLAGSTGNRAKDYHLERRSRETGSGGRAPLRVATLLLFHELGLGVPWRPLLAMTFEKQRPRAKELGAILASTVLGDGDVAAALRKIGEDQAKQLDRQLLANELKPLAESTRADPGRDPRHVPLWDTEQIRDSFGYRIE